MSVQRSAEGNAQAKCKSASRERSLLFHSLNGLYIMV